jgi:cob(I)alamin adenosyltransferase
MASTNALPSVSTGAGDTGTSTLCSDERIRKDDAVFNFMGTVDELSCYIGVCCLYLTGDSVMNLRRAQNQLRGMLGCVACGMAPSRALRQFADDVGAWGLWPGKAASRGGRFRIPGANPACEYLTIAKGVCDRCRLPSGCDAEVKEIAGSVINGLAGYLLLLAGQQEQQVKGAVTRTTPAK